MLGIPTVLYFQISFPSDLSLCTQVCMSLDHCDKRTCPNNLVSLLVGASALYFVQTDILECVFPSSVTSWIFMLPAMEILVMHPLLVDWWRTPVWWLLVSLVMEYWAAGLLVFAPCLCLQPSNRCCFRCKFLHQAIFLTPLKGGHAVADWGRKS